MFIVQDVRHIRNPIFIIHCAFKLLYLHFNLTIYSTCFKWNRERAETRVIANYFTPNIENDGENGANGNIGLTM